ncbi:Kelch repeat-containing protein [Shewanella fodinae]|uniref:N-acetylneuraminic acid mutarotase n=1 Tax=Shewanella fodinae TaxID=552357 RepID=A0A4R2FI11_9GAMM|nr:kelch repeat-containing protein [Shewanella fodinae]TCN89007.1 N-acetylneuraminic acid mutarotase [Shewanella fodinae]
MKILSIALSLLTLTACSTVSTSSLDLRQARIAPAAAVLDNQLYVIGGQNLHGPQGTIEKIDLQKQTVTTLSTKLMPRAYAAAVSDGNGLIYVLGGTTRYRLQGHVANPTVEVFDPQTNEILYSRSLPHPRRAASAVLVDNKIFVIGGSTVVEKPLFRIAPSAKVDILDLKTQTWSTGADMPQAAETKAVVYQGQIYIVGGYNFVHSLPLFARYDPKKNTWQKLKSLPFGISAESAVVVEDKLLTFGDYRKLDLVMAYDFNNQQWQQLDNIPFRPSRHQGIATVDGNIVIVGGTISGKDYMNDIQVLPEAIVNAK